MPSTFPPCQNCVEGDCATCEQIAPPFCGHRADGHPGVTLAQPDAAPAAPAQAPVAEVLDAATRAPQAPETAEQQEVASAPPAAAPVAPEVTSVLDHLASSGALPSFGLPDALPTDEDDPEPVVAALDALTPGVVGLPPAPAAPPAAEPGEDTPAPSEPGGFIMAGPRPEDAYLSLWDTGRAVAGPLAIVVTEDASPGATQAGPPPERADSAHGYAGTLDAPYACACGAAPGSLNKLASHLGITGDDAAVAALGALTVPQVLASQQDAPLHMGEGVPDAASEIANPAVVAGVPEPVAPLEPTAKDLADLEALAAGAPIPVEGGGTMEITGDLTAAVGEALASAQPILGGPGITVPLVHQTEGTPLIPVEQTLEAPAPWTEIIYVNGITGLVVDVDGVRLPIEVADALLEHLGYDPTPVGDDGEPAPTPPAPHLATGTTGRALAGPAPQGKIVRVQVARRATDCVSCATRVEPGETIGLVEGLGWAHLSH